VKRKERNAGKNGGEVHGAIMKGRAVIWGKRIKKNHLFPFLFLEQQNSLLKRKEKKSSFQGVFYQNTGGPNLLYEREKESWGKYENGGGRTQFFFGLGS